MTDNPILSPSRQAEDADAALRPKSLAEFVGQAAAKVLGAQECTLRPFE